MKRYWIVTVLACACLSFAAVWLGGLNQDEGWYLYAANLVHEGQKLYRDFAYTQAPLMPKVYSACTWIWVRWGLLGARIFTLILGCLGMFFASLTARNLVLGNAHFALGERDARLRAAHAAALIVFMLLGCNLYHVYYLAIPKTYALASLFVSMGFYILSLPVAEGRHAALKRALIAACGGLFLAQASGVRISLGAILPVVGIGLMCRGINWIWFGLGAILGLFDAYGFLLLSGQGDGTWDGFRAAMAYHAARGGFDVTWVVGSLSRLVRWYLPVFIVLGLGIAKKVGGGSRWTKECPSVLLSFLAVFVVQMAAPFPYEDYQVPIMGLLAVYAAVNFVDGGREEGQTSNLKAQTFNLQLLLVLGLTFANSFGSPLLEKWMTNGQDRFWSLKKEKCELAQLREAAKRIKEIDPTGTEIFTQDTYLAIETNRKVPKGLEMGPFSILSDEGWRTLIASNVCAVAAISGYTFAIDPPVCNERPLEQQLEYFRLMRQQYDVVDRVSDFGQNATTLLILKRK